MDFPKNVEKMILEVLQQDNSIVFIINKKGIYTQLLGGSNRQYYFDASRLINKSFYDVLSKEKADDFSSFMKMVIENKHPITKEYELAPSDFLVSSEGGPKDSQFYRATLIPFFRAEESHCDRVIWVIQNISLEKKEKL